MAMLGRARHFSIADVALIHVVNLTLVDKRGKSAVGRCS